MHTNTSESKLDLPPVKNCNISIGGTTNSTVRHSFQDLVNNKGTLCILIVTFLDCDLCFNMQTTKR